MAAAHRVNKGAEGVRTLVVSHGIAQVLLIGSRRVDGFVV